MLADLPPGLSIERRSDASVNATWTVKRADGTTVLAFTTPAGDIARTWRAFSSSQGDVLVAERWAQSMGMGVDSWTLTLFHAKGGRVVQLEARDWGPDGVHERNGHLEVLACDWVWPAFGAARESYHFLGRWYAYEGDRLRPLGQTLARPYLYSFEAERGHSYHDGLFHSAAWLRPAKAHPYAGGDPRLGAETAPRVKGRLTDVQLKDGGIQGVFGKPLWIIGSDGPDDGRATVNYVGEGGQLMPAGYRPGDAKAWEGREGELATYGDIRVLWLKQNH